MAGAAVGRSHVVRFVLHPEAALARPEWNPRYRRQPRQPKPALSRDFKAHTGFEPVLPENAQAKPGSGTRNQIAPGSDLNPHLRAVLERLKERRR
jgi:hypothetical protein